MNATGSLEDMGEGIPSLVYISLYKRVFDDSRLQCQWKMLCTLKARISFKRCS